MLGFFCVYTPMESMLLRANLTSVCSNTESNIGIGFEFAQKGAQAIRWLANSMDNNRKGFVLGSDIGAQVNDEALSTLWHKFSVNIPCANTWIGASGWSGTGRRQTFGENNKDCRLSKIFCRSSFINENPTNNYSSPFYLHYYYDASSIIPLTITYTPYCNKWKETHIPSSSLYVAVLGDKLGGGISEHPQQWLAQMAMYRLAKYEPEILDSSAEFNNFVQAANTSRFNWVADIETALANQDTDAATALLANMPEPLGRVIVDSNIVVTDYSDVHDIIAQQVNFYQCYLKYLQHQLSVNDSNTLQALALLCPSSYGPIVYQARAFLQMLTGVQQSYDDDSCTIVNTNNYRIAPISNTPQDLYTLFPNPNNGAFLIKQAIATNKVVDLKVYNNMGAIVYQTSASFVNGSLSLDLKWKAQGVYLLCIDDQQQKPTCIRFLIK
jgi:hypothetical protein